MKFFLSTITVYDKATSNIELTYAFVFLKAFGNVQGHQMSQDGHKLIGTDAVPSYANFDTLPYSLRGIDDMYVLQARIDQWAYDRWSDGSEGRRGITCDFREVTEAERVWFMTKGLYFYTSPLLDDIGYRIVRGAMSRRIRAVAASMLERAETPANAMRHTRMYDYKNARYTALGYKNARSLCTKLGNAIRESIRENDAAICEDFFMAHYDHDIDLHNKLFNHMEEIMSSKGMGLEHEMMYCDHVEENGNHGYVRVNHRLRHYCQHCMQNDDVVVYAHDTDEHMLRDDAYYDDYRDQWLSCQPDSDDYYDSDPDDNSDSTDELMSYSTNVLDHLVFDTSFTSAPFGNFLLGVEFELVTRARMSDAVEDVRSQLGEEYCICKNDGSLPDGGFEIVTAPRALDEHIKRFSEWNVSSDYSAWKNGRCGMHVHIDSRAFTSLTLGKFIMLINTEANAEFIRKIAGRHPLMDAQARSYCRTEMQSELTNPSKALKSKNTDRYTMVNIANLKRAEAKRLGVPSYDSGRYNTVELRIYRASLKKERLLAQLEFTHAAVMFCRVASMRDLDGVSFLKWLKTTDNRYPHLADWYGVRRRPTAKNAEPTEVKCEDTVPPLPPADMRHDIAYPFILASGRDARDFIAQHDLHVEYASIADTNVMYFPYSGEDDSSGIIGDIDVVYTLDDNQWRLQPVGTLANTTTNN
jgi:hypothetical protein